MAGHPRRPIGRSTLTSCRASIPLRKPTGGHTSDLKERVADHNAQRCAHTARFAPWKLKFYGAFETMKQAQDFEHYLKSGSGHSFANRHLLRP
ncbi:MAG TPA: GIY-YIG nuclease family protein [Methylomirabilota bacterium]|nr:GIY-YIG nuclease family protein [Methylomirabilota bacterium]